jgi:hypothetical protein
MANNVKVAVVGLGFGSRAKSLSDRCGDGSKLDDGRVMRP